MRIPDYVRKCVAFVGYKETSGKVHLAGTAFILFRKVGSDYGFAYLVTAKHVITKIADKGCEHVQVRFEFRNKPPEWMEIDLIDWVSHPSDPAVDVSLCSVPGGAADVLDVIPFPVDGAVTPELIEKHEIGVGDEVFLTGLFVNHVGVEHNIPIVRVGNISAMPEEKIKTRMGLMDAYLVESRSIGGLSGSPVFVHLGSIRLMGEGGLAGLKVATGEHGAIFFLGLMHGHWDAPGLTLADLEDASSEERVNMGIAIVVPAEKIIETMRHPKIQREETKIIESEGPRKAR